MCVCCWLFPHHTTLKGLISYVYSTFDIEVHFWYWKQQFTKRSHYKRLTMLPFSPIGEATFRDVHHLLAGLADSFQQRADSSSSTRGLRSQPWSDNQESLWFLECRYVSKKHLLSFRQFFHVVVSASRLQLLFHYVYLLCSSLFYYHVLMIM